MKRFSVLGLLIVGVAAAQDTTTDPVDSVGTEASESAPATPRGDNYETTAPPDVNMNFLSPAGPAARSHRSVL